MTIPFEVVKLYRIDHYIGWRTKHPADGEEFQECYFIKVDGLYLMLGTEEESWYVDEGDN